jgi:hypothetical protein
MGMNKPCPRCRRVSPISARFCPRCGLSFENVPQSVVVAKPPPLPRGAGRSVLTGILGMFVLTVMLAVAAGMFAVRSTSAPAPVFAVPTPTYSVQPYSVPQYPGWPTANAAPRVYVEPMPPARQPIVIPVQPRTFFYDPHAPSHH